MQNKINYPSQKSTIPPKQGQKHQSAKIGHDLAEKRK